MNHTYLIAFLCASIFLCIGVSISYYLVGKHGMSLTFFGYAIANIGLILDSQK